MPLWALSAMADDEGVDARGGLTHHLESRVAAQRDDLHLHAFGEPGGGDSGGALRSAHGDEPQAGSEPAGDGRAASDGTRRRGSATAKGRPSPGAPCRFAARRRYLRTANASFCPAA
jgi:hypothetical protein